jgi:hypothetical protein
MPSSRPSHGESPPCRPTVEGVDVDGPQHRRRCREVLDKCRYDGSARGSATESAAVFDLCVRLKLVDESSHRDGRPCLNERIVSMLVKLARSLEKP